MGSVWQAWIHAVIEAEKDDAFVELLRSRLAGGDRVLRIRIAAPDFVALPHYLLVLARGSQLSELTIPHSDSFTRWSFETGSRMESAEDEALRFSALLGGRLAPLSRAWGETWFRSLAITEIRRLAPPVTCALLRDLNEYEPAEGEARRSGQREFAAILADLSLGLLRKLAYAEPEAAQILDQALAVILEKILLRHRRFDQP